jgi:hypothetical protein
MCASTQGTAIAALATFRALRCRANTDYVRFHLQAWSVPDRSEEDGMSVIAISPARETAVVDGAPDDLHWSQRLCLGAAPEPACESEIV